MCGITSKNSGYDRYRTAIAPCLNLLPQTLEARAHPFQADAVVIEKKLHCGKSKEKAIRIKVSEENVCVSIMPTVLRQDGFRVVIYFDDHLPSHVHVLSADSEVKISLGSETTQSEIIEYRGKRGTAVKALELVIAHQNELLNAWRNIHGES